MIWLDMSDGIRITTDTVAPRSVARGHNNWDVIHRGAHLGEVGLLFVIRIRDPDTRALVHGRLANNGATALTNNIWEMPPAKSDDLDLHAQYWDEEMRWFDET